MTEEEEEAAEEEEEEEVGLTRVWTWGRGAMARPLCRRPTDAAEASGSHGKAGTPRSGSCSSRTASPLSGGESTLCGGATSWGPTGARASRPW